MRFQCQLEESFFRRHPASLRRTAEFIAERVASNAIKKLQRTVLKTLMTECQQWAAAQLLTEPPADVTVNDDYFTAAYFGVVAPHKWPPLSSTWPHLNSDVGLEEGEY